MNIEDIKWSTEIKNKEEKEKVAKKLADKVKDGDKIGFGSGTTSFLTVLEIAKKIRNEKLRIVAVPASNEIKEICDKLEIPVSNLSETKLDWAFDGADEVDKNNWLIKGQGAAMFKEKLNILNSKITYILVDKSKFVEHLCDNYPVPVECYPDSINYVKEQLIKLGAFNIKLRLKDNKEVFTDSNNLILDAYFKDIDETLEKKLKQITGVIETGLFIGYNIQIIE